MKRVVFEIHSLFPDEEKYGDRNGLIYHYTSYFALKSILNNKCIWLTPFSQSNDLSEGRLFYEKLIEYLESQNKKSIINKLNKMFSLVMKNAYLGSFCSFGNKLSQWRGYGNVNIGFDFEKIKTERHFIEDMNRKEHYTSGLFFDKCYYIDPSNQLSIRSNILEFLNSFSDIENIDLDNRDVLQYNALKLGFWLGSIKHMGFIEESEYRAVHCFWDVSPFENPCIDKLFIKLFFNETSIKRIVIGPSKEQDILEEKIISLLNTHNIIYDGVEVFKSKIPFKD